MNAIGDCSCSYARAALSTLRDIRMGTLKVTGESLVVVRASLSGNQSNSLGSRPKDFADPTAIYPRTWYAYARAKPGCLRGEVGCCWESVLGGRLTWLAIGDFVCLLVGLVRRRFADLGLKFHGGAVNHHRIRGPLSGIYLNDPMRRSNRLAV